MDGHTHVKDMQHPQLCQPCGGLQIFVTWMDLLVSVQSVGRFFIIQAGSNFEGTLSHPLLFTE